MTFPELSSELIGSLALAYAVGFGAGLVIYAFRRMLDYV